MARWVDEGRTNWPKHDVKMERTVLLEGRVTEFESAFASPSVAPPRGDDGGPGCWTAA
jgi:hypothetical protein